MNIHIVPTGRYRDGPRQKARNSWRQKCYEIYWDAYLLFRAKARERGAERM